MYRTATAAAYDVLDSVFVTVTVRTYDAMGPGTPSSELHCAATVQSTGEGDTSDWLRDALVALLETL